ncbi:hypothetical protein [Deinococcus sp. Leaf326]|uniref:hypothetical protein n=1 Tax=Deinococcus sp. Leaf326 TaxID=1736338 RepID=UPI0007011A9F|nr:hypothetical protein [Deinococcus sp. Leaf326]KQR41019.1 hypothetical protein ASF71_02475 [Deinococcus sp. Leaf326]
MTSAPSIRPTRPLSGKPAGYVGLASYSSLGRLWALLRGAQVQGRTVSLVRGDPPETARRRVAGYALSGAGFFVDPTPLLAVLDDGFETHPALVALLAGDSGPLRDELNAHFELRLDFVVALTAGRDLIVRPEFAFRPLVPGLSALPPRLPLRARRLARDEVNVLVLRACGLGQDTGG